MILSLVYGRMILGYAYPAYACYKTVERNKPEIEQLRFWCQYWILIAMLTVFERVGETFISWLPMYGEAKLTFIVFLWCSKTKGTTFVYDSFFKPYISKHETEIDRNLLELKTRAGDMAFMYCQKAVTFGQTRIFDVLQFIAAQSTPWQRPAQAQEQTPRSAPRKSSTRTEAAELEVDEPASPTSTKSDSHHDDEMEDEQGSSTSVPLPSPLIKKTISLPIAPGSPKRPVTYKPKSPKPTTMSPTIIQDTVMEDTIRATRGRLRKTLSTVLK
ncbi:hypothetical protein RND81_02G057000 [Saponaria officinalis]|uniref:HVA22-like protein n=1 Tax=Saponaria officinalis TaxID=3572 RepID=A0AAW1MN14_SAPOF